MIEFNKIILVGGGQAKVSGCHWAFGHPAYSRRCMHAPVVRWDSARPRRCRGWYITHRPDYTKRPLLKCPACMAAVNSPPDTRLPPPWSGGYAKHINLLGAKVFSVVDGYHVGQRKSCRLTGRFGDAQNQVILAPSLKGELSLRCGLLIAELRKEFLRLLQDALDRSARAPELLYNRSNGVPRLTEREDRVPMKQAKRSWNRFALSAILEPILNFRRRECKTVWRVQRGSVQT